MALDSGTWGRLNGCVSILWSLTKDNRSACNSDFSFGLV